MERLLLIERAFFCSGAEKQGDAGSCQENTGCEAEHAGETGLRVDPANQDGR